MVERIEREPASWRSRSAVDRDLEVLEDAAVLEVLDVFFAAADLDSFAARSFVLVRAEVVRAEERAVDLVPADLRSPACASFGVAGTSSGDFVRSERPGPRSSDLDCSPGDMVLVATASAACARRPDLEDREVVLDLLPEPLDSETVRVALSMPGSSSGVCVEDLAVAWSGCPYQRRASDSSTRL